MLSYTKNELMSSTEIVRNFSTVLDSIKNHTREKVAVMRKNKMEAVILAIDEYERMQGLAAFVEHFQMFDIIKKREESPVSEYVDFEEILTAHGLDYDDI